MAVRSGLRMHARTHEGGRIGRGEGFSLGARGRRTSALVGKLARPLIRASLLCMPGRLTQKKKRNKNTF